MELAVLAARVESGGKRVEERCVIAPPGERSVELTCVDTNDHGVEACGDEAPR